MTPRVVILALVAMACKERSTAPTPVASVTIESLSTALEVGQQAVLEAKIRSADGGSLSGRSVQWQSSAPTVASVTADATGLRATVVAIAPGAATISASSEGRSASASVTVVAPPTFDFSITDAQWTQGAQQPDGSIPMILDGNAAVLNVIMSTTIANRAPGQVMLTVTDAAGTIVRRDSVAPAAFTDAATYAVPTAQFLLPSSQLRAGLRWSVRRDPRKLLADRDTTNDVFPRAAPATLATVLLPTLRIRFVPITLTVHGGVTGNVSAGNIEAYLPTMRRIFPLGRLVVSVGTPVATFATFGTPPTGGAENFWRPVLLDLEMARVVDPSEPDARWVAVVAPPPGFNFASFGGFASIPSLGSSGARVAGVVHTGWFNNTGQTSDLVAHELAHTFGRRHAPCGNPTGVDAAFPVVTGTIGAPGHDVYAWSSGLSSFASTRPAATGDLMGYCFPQWISPYTYNGILQARVAEGPIVITAALPAVATRQRALVVRGEIVDGRIALLPAVALEGAAASASRGAYRVELIGRDGRVLASQRTSAMALDHSDALIIFAAVPLDEQTELLVESVRVSGPAGVAIRRRAEGSLRALVDGLTTAATLRTLPSGGVEAVCSDARAAAIAVQDHRSGALLASASASRVTVGRSNATSVDIVCSDGVRSLRSNATNLSR